MTRQVTDQLYVELDYYYPEEYVVYIAEAVAACSSQATFVCDATEIVGGTVVEASGSWSSSASVTVSANKIIQGQSALTSAFTQTATISHIEGADLQAFSNAAIAIQITVIKQANVELTSVFSAAINAVRGIYISAQADSTATTVTIGQRVRFTEAAFTAAFSPSLTANILKNSFAVLESQATLLAAVNRNASASASLSSASTLVAQGAEIVNASVNLTSIATLFASRNFGTGRPVALTSTNTTFNSTTKKYGSHSLSFDNTTVSSQDAQIIFTNDNFNMEIPASTDFLIEFWFNLNGGSILGNNNYMLAGVGDMTSLATMNANDSWAIGFQGATGFPRSKLAFKFATASNTFTTIETTEGAYTSGSSTWNHVVITRIGSTITVINNTTGDFGSATYSGAIYQGSYKKLRFRNGFTYTAGSSTLSLLLDEFNFKIGYSAVNSSDGDSYSAQAVNDPDKSVFLYHFNNNLIDDTAATFNQSAALASISSVTATISGPQRASAAITSQSTLVAQVNKTGEINLVAFSNASLSTIGRRIRFADSTQASVSTLVVSTAITKTVSSTQVSQFTQTLTAVKTVAPSITTTAIFSELVAIAKTGQGLIQADVVATVSVTAVKTTNITLSAASQFTQTAEVIKSVTVTASLSSAAALTVANARTRNISSSLESNAQLTANVREIVQLAASLTAVTSMLADTSGIKQFNVIISSQASVTATILRIKDESSSLASEFTQTTETNNSKTATTSAALASEATQTANAGTVKTSAIATDAIFSELVAVAKTGQGFITLDVQALQTTTAVKTAVGSSSLSTTATVSATAAKTQNASASLNTAASFTVTGTFVTTATAHIDVSTALSCNVVKTANAISLEASAGTLTATATTIKSASANLSALAFELAVGKRTQTASAALVSTSSLTVRVGGTFGFRSAMTGFAAEVAVIDIIHIDAKLTWMIFADDRDYPIQSDNRTYSITAEDRDYLIVQEDRTYAVTRELLTTELQGV